MRHGRTLWILVVLAVLPGSGAAQSPQGLDSWFPLLREGMWVKVDGALRDGALHADEIKLYGGELDESEVASTIVAVDVTQMSVRTVFGVVVQANERTDLQGPKGHKHIGFTFLSIGDRIEVEGQWLKDKSFLAEEIEVEESKRLQPDLVDKNEHEVTARIESVDPNTRSIELLGVRVFFSPQTRNKSLLLY